MLQCSLQLFSAFELFAAVEGVPLLGFGLGGGWGGGGEGGNYVRNRRIRCNLQCFLVAQNLTKKPRLRSPLETMRVLQCFLRQEGRMYWYSQYFLDAGYEPFFRRACFEAIRPKEVLS